MPINKLEHRLLAAWGFEGYGKGYDYRLDPMRRRCVDVADREFRDANPSEPEFSDKHVKFVEKRARELDQVGRAPLSAPQEQIDPGDPERPFYGNAAQFPKRVGYGHNQRDSMPGRKVYGDQAKFPKSERQMAEERLTYSGHEKDQALKVKQNDGRDYYGRPDKYPVITKSTPGRQGS